MIFRYMEIKIINKSNNPLPCYQTPGSAGADLRAWIEDGSTIVLEPMKTVLVHTGLYISLPVGYEARVQPRSGLALKYQITVLNSPGCIDADYRGEIGIILINLSDKPFEINNGDRVAQMIISKVETVRFNLVEELDKTERVDGGFGHTGIK